MGVNGLDHLEFYVGDARQTAYFLCTAFGFRVRAQGGPQTGLAGQRSLLLVHGDVHLLLTSGLSQEHPATEYVSRHGDGVAVIAMSVDDVDEVYRTAATAGAVGLKRPMTHENAGGGDALSHAEVSGFGDVTHRLVRRARADRFWLPGLVEQEPREPEDDGLLEVTDHLAVCLPAGELGKTSAFYQEAFGFHEIFEEYIDIGGQGMDSRVVQSASREVTLTLIEPDPTRRSGQVDDFLSWHSGAGVQHVAFSTKDIIKAVATFSARGVGFASTPGSYYDALAERLGTDISLDDLRRHGVLVDEDHWGQMYQIFTQSMHVRRTLFLELIERHGARTFGSSNIKALYEAKERELTRAE